MCRATVLSQANQQHKACLVVSDAPNDSKPVAFFFFLPLLSGRTDLGHAPPSSPSLSSPPDSASASASASIHIIISIFYFDESVHAPSTCAGSSYSSISSMSSSSSSCIDVSECAVERATAAKHVLDEAFRRKRFSAHKSSARCIFCVCCVHARPRMLIRVNNDMKQGVMTCFTELCCLNSLILRHCRARFIIKTITTHLGNAPFN